MTLEHRERILVTRSTSHQLTRFLDETFVLYRAEHRYPDQD